MILSHRNKAIYIRTRKTASTSFEIAFSQICGEEDILTPLRDKDEQVRRNMSGIGPQNNHFSIDALKQGIVNGQYQERLVRAMAYLSPRTVIQIIGEPHTENANYELYQTLSGEEDSDFTVSNDGRDHIMRYVDKQKQGSFYKHIPARAVREIVGDSLWERYHTFSVDRNPIEMIRSFYLWEKKVSNITIDIDEFLGRYSCILSNWDLYTDIGHSTVICDQIIRYEDIYDGLSVLSSKLGLDTLLSIEGIVTKPSTSDGEKEKAKNDLSEDQKRFIQKRFKLQRKTLGYE